MTGEERYQVRLNAVAARRRPDVNLTGVDVDAEMAGGYGGCDTCGPDPVEIVLSAVVDGRYVTLVTYPELVTLLNDIVNIEVDD